MISVVKMAIFTTRIANLTDATLLLTLDTPAKTFLLTLDTPAKATPCACLKLRLSTSDDVCLSSNSRSRPPLATGCQLCTFSAVDCPLFIYTSSHEVSFERSRIRQQPQLLTAMSDQTQMVHPALTCPACPWRRARLRGISLGVKSPTLRSLQAKRRCPASACGERRLAMPCLINADQPTLLKILRSNFGAAYDHAVPPGRTHQPYFQRCCPPGAERNSPTATRMPGMPPALEFSID